MEKTMMRAMRRQYMKMLAPRNTILIRFTMLRWLRFSPSRKCTSSTLHHHTQHTRVRVG
jgi:hypothetical protein